MMKVQRGTRGYSMVELLTVVAIIGVLSMIGVPAFMNYRKSQSFKNSMRTFTTDIRAARQRAVSTTTWVRIGNMVNAGTAPEQFAQYEISESRDRGTTWTLLDTKGLEKRTTFDGTPADLIYLPNGTLQLPPGTFSTTVTLKSLDTIAKPTYAIDLSVTGKVSAN